MKKSILMAIVALALLAAPAFAGDYSIVGNIDYGFGFALGTAEDNADQNWATNDFTMLGFFGSLDANNSIAVVMEYGASGDASVFIDGGLAVAVTDFNLTTNVLGSFGLTDLPVTLFMTAGHGRLNLHNRFQQWTGWEIKTWKNSGTAHFSGSYSAQDPGAWSRPNYLKLQVGIVNMVNVAFGFVPVFNHGIADGTDVKADVPMMIDVWTSGITVGPVALDIAANLRSDNLNIRTGLQATANMNFGALSLMVFLGEDYQMSTADGAEGYYSGSYIAVKPSYNFGAGSAALGAWMGLDTTDNGTDLVTYMTAAIDLSVSFSTFTLYGGVLLTDLSGEIDDDTTPMKWDVGVKNAFGAATIAVGLTGVSVGDLTNTATGYSIGGPGGAGNLNDFDIGAADGSGQNWFNADGDAVATMYFRVTAWY